jgi:excisionase family DNA binding protein
MEAKDIDTVISLLRGINANLEILNAATKADENSLMTEKFYTVKDINAQFGISDKKILKEIRAGRLKARKTGRSYLFKKSDIETWFNSIQPCR